MIGTAALRHHDALRHLGAEPIDYDDARLDERVRELAPNGVQAVFDHLGGESFRRSFDLLASGGTLVGYGTATQRDGSNNLIVTFAGIFARFALWSALPNGRRATFYNFWGGSKARPGVFRQRLAADLTHVLELMRDGATTPQVAARIPLREASRGLALAESKTVRGKVVLVP